MSSAGSQFPFACGSTISGKFITRKRTVNDMAKQGQKLDDELKESIRAALVLTQNKNEISKKLGVSWSTVDKVAREIEQTPEENEKFEKLREDKKEMVISKIWDGFMNGVTLGNKMIEEALEGKREIPLNQLSTYNGTMFDKHALMTGGKTASVSVKLEDFFS